MKVVAVVPVKLNNERLPNKNTKLFSNGKPLISYVLETLKKVSGISEIYVYCSNDAILPYLQKGVIYKNRSHQGKSLGVNDFSYILTARFQVESRRFDLHILI